MLILFFEWILFLSGCGNVCCILCTFVEIVNVVPCNYVLFCIQVNAVLLTISLGSLAKSQLGKTTSEMTTEKDEMRKEYMEVGK